MEISEHCKIFLSCDVDRETWHQIPLQNIACKYPHLSQNYFLFSKLKEERILSLKRNKSSRRISRTNQNKKQIR